MKRLLFVLTLLAVLPICALGQNMKIHISDALSGKPLPFANIYFKSSGVGSSTDLSGNAIFPQNKLLLPDTIVVSYVGYHPKKAPVATHPQNTQLDIKLTPSAQQIAEVVIEYERPPKPKKIIRTALKNSKENYAQQDVILHSLYRETVIENGTSIQLNEAFTETYFTSYPQPNLDKKIWQDWFYDEQYAFELEGNRYFRQLLKDFNTKQEQQTVVASRRSENWSKYGLETTLLGDPLLLLSLDKIKYEYDFLYPRNLSKYAFKHEGLEDVNGETCYVISFYPESTNRKFSIDQSRKNNSAIYIGRMYIAKSSFALVRFEYKLAVDRDFGFFAATMPLDYTVEMNYKKTDDIWFIDRIKFTETRKVDTKKNGESILHTAEKELFVFDIQTENVIPFADSTLFKSTQYSAIRHYRRNYNPDYWKSQKLPDHAKLPASVINNLEVEKPLDAQFDKFRTIAKEDLPTPISKKRHFEFNYHDLTLVDSLHWMALPPYEEELKTHLAAENKFAKNALIENRKFQKLLFEKLNDFYVAVDDAVNVQKPGSYFIDTDSLSHLIFYQQQDSVAKTAVLDITAFLSNRENIFLKRIIPNDSKTLILVQFEQVGTLGDYACVIPFGNLNPIDSVANVYSLEWFSDSTFLYALYDKIGRAGKLIHHPVDNGGGSLIFSEPDQTFDIEVVREGEQLFCTIQSKTENEIYRVVSDENAPKFELIKKRQPGVMNTVRVSDGYYFLVDDENSGSFIEFSAFDRPDEQQIIVAPNKKLYITDFTLVGDRIVAVVYDKATPRLMHIRKGDSQWNEIDLDLGIGQYDLFPVQEVSDKVTFRFSSPAHPFAVYAYNFELEKLTELSKTEINRNRNPKYISTRRLWAKSHDGEKIPITIFSNRASMSTQKGLILKTYGAYGALPVPAFDASENVLLELGYTIAYAHVRGESILGADWYKTGRGLNKKNSIQDYLACAEYLIKKGIATPEYLVGYGNSAGGLVVAQAANLRPELFNTIVLDHPYLDVVNTMMNDTLPLTVDEYKEWGNPQRREVFDYIASYSPYQNISNQDYPNVLFIASYQDYQTPVWQIAKYAAKLRQYNSADNEILLLTDMQSGHIGNTSGKEWIKLFSETYSFVHLKLGL